MSDEPFPGSAADFYERIQEYKGIGERLRETDERLSAALEEIERLKESAKYDAFLREKYRDLITELCDALVTEEIMSDEGDDLIKRAREATR